MACGIVTSAPCRRCCHRSPASAHAGPMPLSVAGCTVLPATCSGRPLRACLLRRAQVDRFDRLLQFQRAAFDRLHALARTWPAGASASRVAAHAGRNTGRPAPHPPAPAASPARRSAHPPTAAAPDARGSSVGLAADRRRRSRCDAAGRARTPARAHVPPVPGRCALPSAPSIWPRTTASWLARKCFSAASNAGLPPSCTATASAMPRRSCGIASTCELAVAVEAEHRAALLAQSRRAPPGPSASRRRSRPGSRAAGDRHPTSPAFGARPKLLQARRGRSPATSAWNARARRVVCRAGVRPSSRCCPCRRSPSGARGAEANCGNAASSCDGVSAPAP